VVGIASLFLSSWPFVGFGLGICAVVTGFVARGRIKRAEADNKGSTIVGIWLGYWRSLSAVRSRFLSRICSSNISPA
jgi:hypothetical protein